MAPRPEIRWGGKVTVSSIIDAESYILSYSRGLNLQLIFNDLLGNKLSHKSSEILHMGSVQS